MGAVRGDTLQGYCTRPPSSALNTFCRSREVAIRATHRGVFPPESSQLRAASTSRFRDRLWCRCSGRAPVAAQTPLFSQGFILLPKTECDVREVEFARCLRLRQTSLEPVAFRLPRVRVRLGAWHPNT